MSNISMHVGSRIRTIRKKRGYTIEEFSKMINKSKATLSKYENGSISIDIDTILEIAVALEVEVDYLINYKMNTSNKTLLLKNSYFNRSNLYLYYYDGKNKKIATSLLVLSERNKNSNVADAVFYENVSDFNNFTDCRNVFKGAFMVYDTSTYCRLICQMNPASRIYLTLSNPTAKGLPAAGIMTNVSSPPTVLPTAIKVVVSKDMLEEDEALIEYLKISKEEIKLLRKHNMLFTQPPTTKLNTKK